MLELRGVDKSFPGVRALRAVDFKIARGEIVGLVGENGAGKSTLMKIINGAVQHDNGMLLIQGKEVRFDNTRQAMDMGIGMVFQEQSLIGGLSVMENIFLGFERRFRRRGVINWRAMSRAARHQLAKVKLEIDPGATTNSLSFAQRQLVELAKVLSLEERVQGDLVILLDEPTSVLSPEEVQLLFSLVRDLRSRASFIFVSHRLDEIIALSDRIYVMKDGEVVDMVDARTAVVEAIQHKMVGRDINTEYYRENKQAPYDPARILIDAESIGRAGHYEDVTLKLHAGEVLAIVGTDGSGREEIMRSIFGLDRPDRGRISVKGVVRENFSAADGVARGMGYIPRERKVEGIVSGMNVYENMTLCQLGRYSRRGVLEVARERELAVEWIRRLSIKASSELADCGNLSESVQKVHQ